MIRFFLIYSKIYVLNNILFYLYGFFLRGFHNHHDFIIYFSGLVAVDVKNAIIVQV